MERFFSIEGKFFRAMTIIADLLVLNLMWIVTSIPLITIGASTTALFSVTMDMAENKDSYIIKSFVKVFLRSLKTSTFLWMIFLTIQMIPIVGINILPYLEGAGKEFMIVAVWIFEIIVLLIWIPVIPLRVTCSDYTIADTIRRAMFTAIVKLPWTVMILMGTMVLAGVTFFYPLYIIPLWMFIGIAGNAWLVSNVYLRYIAMY